MPDTPFFPAWRGRFANFGRRVRHLRQHSLLQLDLLLLPFLPAGLLSPAEEGPNSRERVYSVRRTFFGFLSQVLKPECSCREIVRQILALCALHSHDASSPGTSAYCQARQRLPWDILPRLRCALADTPIARVIFGRASVSKSSMAPASACPIPKLISVPIPNPENSSRAAVSRC